MAAVVVVFLKPLQVAHLTIYSVKPPIRNSALSDAIEVLGLKVWADDWIEPILELRDKQMASEEEN